MNEKRREGRKRGLLLRDGDGKESEGEIKEGKAEKRGGEGEGKEGRSLPYQ